MNGYARSRKRSANDDCTEVERTFPVRKKIRKSAHVASETTMQRRMSAAVATLDGLVPSGASDLQTTIRDAAQTTFDRLGPGLTESVYRDALAVELQHRRINVWSDREVILPIHHRNRYVGFCRSDIVLLCSIEPKHSLQCNDCASQESGTATKQAAVNKIEAKPIVIELKAVSSPLNSCNVQQLSAYMRLLSAERGVLINFLQGDAALQQQLVRLRNLASDADSCLELPKKMTDKTPIQCVFVHLTD